MRPIPSPVTTATTLVVGAGPVSAPRPAPAPGRVGRLADPALLLHLLGQVGDPDALRPPGVDAGLDGRPDVVGVDVAVPQPVAPDHHDGVADAGPHLLEVGHGVVRRVEEVHDLVAQVAHVGGRSLAPRSRPPWPWPLPWPLPADRRQAATGRPRAPPRARAAVGGRRPRTSSASSRRRKPVPPASTTPACASTGSMLGRPGQRVGRGSMVGLLDHRDQRRPVAGGAGGRPVGRGRGHGQDRPLDRAHHGPAGQVGGVAQGVGQHGGVRPRRLAVPAAPSARTCPAGAGTGSRPSSPGPP